jgi:predicted enzyme related to lactoylglutathione lyase
MTGEDHPRIRDGERGAAAMKKIDIIIDCADPDRLAEFWSAALGYEKVRRFGHYTMLSRGGPGFPRLGLQRVPELKATKNRVHLDIIEADIDAEATRLEELGARRLEDAARREQVDNAAARWIVMADPEGNEFCVCDGGTAIIPGD